MPDVICIGELLIDFVATESNADLPDVPGFIGAPGGAPANVAVAVQRLGLSAGFVGKVGDDPFGVKLRRTLDETGVDTRYLLIDPDARTTIVFVAVWDNGRKDMCFYRNPGADMRLLPDEITPAIFEGARGFHYGSITLIDEPGASAQRKALQMARDKGLMLSYDPNYRPTLWPDEATARRVIFDAFQYAHLAKISEEEWAVATGHADLDAGIRAVLDQGVELLVISRGEKGALATNGDYRIEIPALDNLNVVETTGAGDGFMGAMITRLLPEFEARGSLAAIDEATVRDALHYANHVGGLTCTQPGAIPALPFAADVAQFIASRNETE
jgi:fructokinase